MARDVMKDVYDRPEFQNIPGVFEYGTIKWIKYTGKPDDILMTNDVTDWFICVVLDETGNKSGCYVTECKFDSYDMTWRTYDDELVDVLYYMPHITLPDDMLNPLGIKQNNWTFDRNSEWFDKHINNSKEQ